MSLSHPLARAFARRIPSGNPHIRQHGRSNPLRRGFQRRGQSTAADATAGEQSGFAKYWNSPVGPKTVHFWAPIMKWGVVLAGVSDFAKPASALSLNQNCALMATGAIWTRWCFIIKPRNIFLATVNFFLFCVGATQTARVLLYRSSSDGQSVDEEAKRGAEEAKESVKTLVNDPKKVAEKVTQS